MYNVLKALHSIGFLKKTVENGEDIFHLSTPCRFRIDESVVRSLKENYRSDEKIGGVLWAKPTLENKEYSYTIRKVSYIRNVIEDVPGTDHLNKSNAYLPDKTILIEEIEKIIQYGILPLKFHSHPITGRGFIQSLMDPNFFTQSSDKYVFESSLLYSFGNEKLLIPNFLIVGNELCGEDIFIGINNVSVATESFVERKKKGEEGNLKKMSEHVSTINLTNVHEAELAIGALLLLYVIAKDSKYSLPVVLRLAAMFPQLLTNSVHQSDLHYFNKLTPESINILIPETLSIG